MTPQSMYRVYSRAIRELGYSPEEWGVSGYAILDDHVPFMERGVDTLNLIDDFQDGNWWHTSKDNIGILGEKILPANRGNDPSHPPATAARPALRLTRQL